MAAPRRTLANHGVRLSFRASRYTLSSCLNCLAIDVRRFPIEASDFPAYLRWIVCRVIFGFAVPSGGYSINRQKSIGFAFSMNWLRRWLGLQHHKGIYCYRTVLNYDNGINIYLLDPLISHANPSNTDEHV